MNTNQQALTHEEIQDVYVQKVNALVATDRDHLIADITAEYARMVDGIAEHGEPAAA